MLDCGTGTAANLQRYIPPAELDCVVVSHMHPDHSADLIPLGFALMKAKVDGQLGHPVRVLLPPGGSELLQTILELQGNLGRHVLTGIELSDYSEGIFEMAGISLHFFPTGHAMNCHGVKVTHSEGSLGYTADSAFSAELITALGGVDLLLAEAGGVSAEQARTTNHMLPEEAAELGVKAQAGALVLTHFLPGTDVGGLKERVQAAFGGEVLVAHEGLVVNR